MPKEGSGQEIVRHAIVVALLAGITALVDTARERHWLGQNDNLYAVIGILLICALAFSITYLVGTWIERNQRRALERLNSQPVETGLGSIDGLWTCALWEGEALVGGTLLSIKSRRSEGYRMVGDFYLLESGALREQPAGWFQGTGQPTDDFSLVYEFLGGEHGPAQPVQHSGIGVYRFHGRPGWGRQTFTGHYFIIELSQVRVMRGQRWSQNAEGDISTPASRAALTSLCEPDEPRSSNRTGDGLRERERTRAHLSPLTGLNGSRGPSLSGMMEATVICGRFASRPVSDPDHMDLSSLERAQSFFETVRTEFVGPSEDVCSIVITHLLDDRPALLEAIDRSAPIACLMPKPKTVNPTVAAWIRHRYCIEYLSRDLFRDSRGFFAFIEKLTEGRRFLVLDIGGYAADVHNVLSDRYGSRYIGAVEDTENGHQKYEGQIREKSKPVLSVARSPLKSAEDFLVGQSIVFSVEALLREQSDILHGRSACVIGYGKVGRSIAGLLHARHVRTVVYDTNPIQKIDAMSHGFFVPSTLETALKNAGIIFCATGNLALKREDFALLGSGAYIATVTSSEDELDLGALKGEYTAAHIDEYITRYRRAQHQFFVLNRGQAVNFVHGAAVGPFIYLVHAEIIASIGRLLSGEALGGRVTENAYRTRRRIAELWFATYGSASESI